MSLSIYNLLPYILRFRDHLASSGVKDEGNVELWCQCVDEIINDFSEDIEGIRDLEDLDRCPIQFLPLLSRLLGVRPSPDWSEAKKRMFLKAAWVLWRIGGTRQSWVSTLNIRGWTGYFPWELWKSKIYEEFDYALYPDYDHRYKAARVDIRTPTQNVQPPRHGIFSPKDYVEPYRPIHVTLRYDGTSYKYVAEAPGISDGDDLGDPSQVIFEDLEQIDYSIEADYSISFSCIGSCETSCQTQCTTTCEVTCEYGTCETSCESFCEGDCQNICEYDCQTGCEGTCECYDCQVDSCQVGCQVNCENYNQP